jgi:hypothetical protein
MRRFYIFGITFQYFNSLSFTALAGIFKTPACAGVTSVTNKKARKLAGFYYLSVANYLATVTERRLRAHEPSSDPEATGRSLP